MRSTFLATGFQAGRAAATTPKAKARIINPAFQYRRVGFTDLFKDIMQETEYFYSKLSENFPEIKNYILTNAHKKRVLLTMNVRELYHFVNLRDDEHAQWDIRNVSMEMSEKAKEVMPLTCEFIGGKDRYNDIYQSIYGHLPKITEAVLPGSRDIK